MSLHSNNRTVTKTGSISHSSKSYKALLPPPLSWKLHAGSLVHYFFSPNDTHRLPPHSHLLISLDLCLCLLVTATVRFYVLSLKCTYLEWKCGWFVFFLRQVVRGSVVLPCHPICYYPPHPSGAPIAKLSRRFPACRPVLFLLYRDSKSLAEAMDCFSQQLTVALVLISNQ